MRAGERVELCVVGAGALNQAIKAVAIARTFVAEDGIDLICVPTFGEVDIAGESRTAIRVRVEDRRSSGSRFPSALDLTEPAVLPVEPLQA